jgi:hypothetical protein
VVSRQLLLRSAHVSGNACVETMIIHMFDWADPTAVDTGSVSQIGLCCSRSRPDKPARPAPLPVADPRCGGVFEFESRIQSSAPRRTVARPVQLALVRTEGRIHA